MLIILDTNIFQEDYLLRTGRTEVLLDYAERTQTTFLLPRIVLQELTANYERELNKRLTSLVRAREQLNGIRLERDETRTEVDSVSETSGYIAFLKKKLRISEKEIVDYQPEYLERVVARAINRKRPCTERGEEIRDALLWESLLDAAQQRGEPLIFISRNTDQFTADKIALHPDLAAEVTARGVSVSFVPSLEEFAKQHATKIAFISKAWLEAHIDADAVLEQGYDTLMEAAWEAAKRRSGWDEELEGGFHLETGGVEVDEFFVYEMSTGELRVETTWFGVCTIGYDVAVEEANYESSYSGRFSRSSKSREIEMSLHIVTQALIRDERLTEWSMIDAWAESY